MHRTTLRLFSLGLALTVLTPLGCDVKTTSLDKDDVGVDPGDDDDGGAEQGDDEGNGSYGDGGDGGNGDGGSKGGDEGNNSGGDSQPGEDGGGDEGGLSCEAQRDTCLAEDNPPALCDKLFAACQGGGYEGGDDSNGDSGPNPGDDGGEAEADSGNPGDDGNGDG